MTRENMVQYLNDMGTDISCLEGECEVELGRNIGVDLIVSGDVVKIKEVFILTLKLHSTVSGKSMSIERARDKDTFVLIDKTDQAGRYLLANGLDLKVEKNDLKNAKLKITVDYMVEAGLAAFGGISIIFATNQLGEMRLAYDQAASITETNQVNEYDTYKRNGDTAAALGYGGLIAGATEIVKI